MYLKINSLLQQYMSSYKFCLSLKPVQRLKQLANNHQMKLSDILEVNV